MMLCLTCGGSIEPGEIAFEFAIYEIFALILAIPMSYGLAKLAKYWSSKSWLDEVDQVFQSNWNGRPEDELYAWMKTRNVFENRPGRRPRQRNYIERQINFVNRRKLYSEVTVNDEGIVSSEQNPQT